MHALFSGTLRFEKTWKHDTIPKTKYFMMAVYKNHCGDYVVIRYSPIIHAHLLPSVDFFCLCSSVFTRTPCNTKTIDYLCAHPNVLPCISCQNIVFPSTLGKLTPWVRSCKNMRQVFGKVTAQHCPINACVHKHPDWKLQPNCIIQVETLQVASKKNWLWVCVSQTDCPFILVFCFTGCRQNRSLLGHHASRFRYTNESQSQE